MIELIIQAFGILMLALACAAGFVLAWRPLIAPRCELERPFLRKIDTLLTPLLDAIAARTSWRWLRARNAEKDSRVRVAKRQVRDAKRRLQDEEGTYRRKIETSASSVEVENLGGNIVSQYGDCVLREFTIFSPRHGVIPVAGVQASIDVEVSAVERAHTSTLTTPVYQQGVTFNRPTGENVGHAFLVLKLPNAQQLVFMFTIQGNSDSVRQLTAAINNRSLWASNNSAAWPKRVAIARHRLAEAEADVDALQHYGAELAKAEAELAAAQRDLGPGAD